MSEVKLNLGCGPKRLEGYINVDLHVDADLKHNLLEPLPFEDGSIDEVLASHLLEHFSYAESHTVLKDWVRVLKHGGKLRIIVPDLEKNVANLLHATNFEQWRYWLVTIYGGQWNDGEFHKNGFNAYKLKMCVDIAGNGCMVATQEREQDPAKSPEIDITFTKYDSSKR